MHEYQRIVAAYEPVVQKRVRHAYWRGIAVGALVTLFVLVCGGAFGAYLAFS